MDQTRRHRGRALTDTAPRHRADGHEPDGTPVDSVREAAPELLTYLAAHRDGASLEDIKEALYGDATRERARQRLSTDVANLRNRLRHAHPGVAAASTTASSAASSATNSAAQRAASGATTTTSAAPATPAGVTGVATGNPSDHNDHRPVLGDPVVNTGGRYHLNPDLIDVDWWRLQDAIRRAKQATTPAEQRAALERALAAYRGPLADDRDYEWATRAREHTRRAGTWVRARLATLIAAEHPARAAALLDDACADDPYDEDLARLALQAHARTGNLSALKTRMSRLRGALDELDETPDEQTEVLAKKLIDNLTAKRTPRRPGGRP